MEKFEKTLKLRLVFCIVAALVGMVLMVWLILSAANISPQQKEQLAFGSFTLGFCTGISGGLTLVNIIKAVRFARAIRNEALRQKLYIEETDERKQFVRRQASNMYRTASLPLLIVATIITANFNATVFYTMLFTTLGLALLMCFLKLVCLKRY